MRLESVTAPFVAVWDVDVIASKEQIIQSVHALREEHFDFVYPYEKKLLDTSSILRELFLRKLNIKVLERNRLKMTALCEPDPVGGAFFLQNEQL